MAVASRDTHKLVYPSDTIMYSCWYDDVIMHASMSLYGWEFKILFNAISVRTFGPVLTTLNGFLRVKTCSKVKARIRYRLGISFLVVMEVSLCTEHLGNPIRKQTSQMLKNVQFALEICATPENPQ